MPQLSPGPDGPGPGRVSNQLPWRAPFVRFLVGRGMSAAGSNLVSIVLAFAVVEVGGDAFAVGVVLTCSVAAQSIMLPLGGVLADRLPRRRLVVTANGVLAALQLTMGTLLLAVPERVEVWMFAGAAAITGASSAVTKPALHGIVVQIVPPTALQQANAWLRLVLNVARIALPGLGATLGAVFGYGQVLVTAGAAFATCAVVLGSLRLAPVARTPSRWWADVRAGWGAFVQRAWLWTLVLSGTIAVPLWLAGYQLLGPVIAADRPAGLQYWGWAISAFAAGMLLGSLIALRWRPRRLLLAMVLIQLLWPVPLAVLALDVHLAWVIAPMLLSGMAIDLSIVLYDTARQQQVPEELIGRVTSINSLGELILVPVGYLLGGFVASRIGTAGVMWACFAGIVAVTVALFAVRSIRTLERADESVSNDDASETVTPSAR